MSLINFILQQRLIMITLGLAGAIMALALLLLIVLRIRRLFMKFSARRVAQRDAARIDEIDPDEAETLVDAPELRAAIKTATAGTTTAGTTTAAAGGATPVPPAAKPAPVSVLSTITPAATPAATEGDISDEMKNLLSDVFLDEKALERYQLLLKDASEINMEDLALLAQSVIDRLKGNPPVEVRSVPMNGQENIG